MLRTSKTYLAIGISMSCLLFQEQIASAASTTANALQSVVAAIAIVKVSDLDFGAASPNDPLLTIAPGTSENANNASFTVTGAPSQAYTVTLPVGGVGAPPVVMAHTVNGPGLPVDEIPVYDFASDTAEGSTTLSVGGTQTLYVGATRGAINPAQNAGSYTAPFTVTVVY